MLNLKNFYNNMSRPDGTKMSLKSDFKTSPTTAEIILLIDRSGSMQQGRDDFEGGINAFLDEQRQADGEARLTIVTFDDQVEIEYHGDIKQSPVFKLSPRGSTSLNDAMGQSINAIGELLEKTPEEERPKFISFVTTTDGGENSSQEFTTKSVQEMIEHQTEKYNWSFTFLGADYDAVSDRGYASSAGNAANFGKGNAMNFYAGTSAKLSAARGMSIQGVHIDDVVASMEYTDQERKEFDS